MPTYEYQCLACQHRFELRQRISEEPITECPECRGAVVRLIGGGGGFLVKGAGSAVGSHTRGGDDCTLTRTGSTCCGRDRSCGKPCGS